MMTSNVGPSSDCGRLCVLIIPSQPTQLGQYFCLISAPCLHTNAYAICHGRQVAKPLKAQYAMELRHRIQPVGHSHLVTVRPPTTPKAEAQCLAYFLSWISQTHVRIYQQI